MRRVWFAMLLALLASGDVLAQTPPVRLELTWSSEGPLANVRIAWVPPVAVRLEMSGREALLRFDGPVAALEARDLQRDLARFVETASTGFDTLLIVGTSGTVATMRREGTGANESVVLVLRVPERPVADETAPDGIVVERAERRLERLRASLESQTGKSDIARGRLARLAEQDPNDADTLQQWAAVERQIGRPMRAAALLARADLLDPDNAEIVRARAELSRADAPSLRVEPEYRRTSAAEKRYTLGTAIEAPISDMWRATAAFDTVLLDSPGVRRPNGYSSSFKGGRQRGAIGLVRRNEDGGRLQGQLFANAARLGAGFSSEVVGDLARYGLGIEIAKPYWDFSESIVADGTRDRISAEYVRPWLVGLSVRARGGFSRYSLPGYVDGARSATLDGEARLPLDGLANGASLAYVFDGEYPFRIVRAQDPAAAGTEFRPVPLRYREVHGLLAGYMLDFRRAFDSQWQVVADVSAGPAYDRYGHRGGPLAGASLSWLGDDALQAGLRGFYGRGVGRDSSASITIGGFLTWRM